MKRSVMQEDLTAYLRACRQAPRAVRRLVLGHRAPDGDAVISSLMEAFGRSARGEKGVAVLIPAKTIPTEVAWLLGEEICALLPLEDETIAVDWLADPAVELVLTDHHEEPNLQNRVVGVIDHHLPIRALELPEDAVNIQTAGAASTLVALDWQRHGLEPDRALARLLLGGILLDTEGLHSAKAKAQDQQAAQWLIRLSGEDPTELFDALQLQLLSETEMDTLYTRDYRRFPVLGFAVLKVWETTPVDETALRNRLAADRREHGYAACVAKVTRYGKQGILDETFVFSAEAPLLSCLLQVMEEMSPGCTVCSADQVYIAPAGKFVSRKRLAPRLLEKLPFSETGT